MCVGIQNDKDDDVDAAADDDFADNDHTDVGARVGHGSPGDGDDSDF